MKEKLQLTPQKYKRSQEITMDTYTDTNKMDSLEEMNKSPEMWKLSRLKEKEIKNVNKPITNNEINNNKKKKKKKKTPYKLKSRTRGLHGWILPNI